jgi:CheY-like chemotaxis protein
MNPKRILLIDDDDTIREVAQLSLEAVGGYDVSSASGGAEGLVKAAQEHPDAILLDMMMPDMDGPTTVAKLRADPATCDIPVILLTAKVHGAERGQWTELGVVGLIAKPFDPMHLSAKVADMLGWPPP